MLPEKPQRGTINRMMQEAQTAVDRYISQFKEGYFPHLLNLARLTEEVGEIARVVAGRNGKTPKAGDPNNLAEELADAMFVIICMANLEGVDLGHELNKVIDKYNQRDSSRWSKKE